MREAPQREPQREQVADTRAAPSGLLRQAAMHLPISSANAATLPPPSGSALGGVSRGMLAPPVPLPVPVPVR
ncbi:hypothetical protein HMPREF9946_03571 [Acetobacteraceae bacterium AT-5844]|nr:hypothetical protein HMPREF9946_03571 [Acetobacteraceae bacterium AT-5844]